jgi:hypothetical protein
MYAVLTNVNAAFCMNAARISAFTQGVNFPSTLSYLIWMTFASVNAGVNAGVNTAIKYAQYFVGISKPECRILYESLQ